MTAANPPKPTRSGYCGAAPWPLPDDATYDPHKRCSLPGCVCPCHVVCTGAGDCPAQLHVHGCFADLDGTGCDDPEDHLPTVLQNVEIPGADGQVRVMRNGQPTWEDLPQERPPLEVGPLTPEETAATVRAHSQLRPEAAIANVETILRGRLS